MTLRTLDPEADLQLDDEIVTSAYQGGLFPGGIPIGTVSAVGAPGNRLVREVQVAPFVDFTRIHHVLVVVGAPVEDVPPLTDLQDLEFDPPPVPPTVERTPRGPTEDGDAGDDADPATDPDADPELEGEVLEGEVTDAAGRAARVEALAPRPRRAPPPTAAAP
jgi:rod shape-determining protein MreC